MNHRVAHTTTKRAAIFALLFAIAAPVLVQAQAPGNNTCAGAYTIVSGPSCVDGTSRLTGQTLKNATTDNINASCGTDNTPDVWYVFQAQSTRPKITLSNLGSNLNSSSKVRIEVLSRTGPCTGLAEVQCASATSLTLSTDLTVGDYYYARVYRSSTSVPTGSGWDFSICITDDQANDDCSGAITLNSSTTCNYTRGYVNASSNSAVSISPSCAPSTAYDVWYRFTAQTTNPTITLANIGSGFLSPQMELIGENQSTHCSGYTSLFCGTTTINADFLTPGSTYLIRVFSSGGAVPTTAAAGQFDICIQDPVSSAPYNDECSDAINIPIWNSCNNITGNMAGATPSSKPLSGSCTGPLVADVWYKFTAINNTATITLSGMGSNLGSARVEMFSGNCSGLTSIGCGANPLTVSTLTAGNTYYVRVYTTSGPVPNGNAGFNICATTSNAPLRFGNSYVNITKKTTGGVVEKGDILEIRMTVNHTSGTMYAMRYVDNIPTNTSFPNTSADSIRIITNEGLTFRRYTPLAGDDAAVYNASPGAGEYNIRMNLGFGTTNPGKPVNTTATEATTATGQMNAGSNNPRGGGGMLFAVAYRVKVTGNAGDTINIQPGRFIYRTSAGGSDITLVSTPYQILITEPLSLCSNSIGVNNAVESGGTFGSGTTLNRATDLANPIAGYTFVSDVNAINSVGDGRYAIVNNTSPRSMTSRTARRQNTCNSPSVLLANDVDNCNSRMFGGFWFVDGDHSGTSNAIGNVPVAKGDNGGYMLAVNADYVASEVYRQKLTNLCPNTYYEFSAWFRNICPTCGLDSNGTQTYKPGVLPNLSFSLDGVDRYSTGEIDTVGWVKKGFMFVTGPTQDSAVFSIRNNAQGGGGNDWVMDDISIATCLPNMQYSPSLNPFVCENNNYVVRDTIRSYFDNYRYHQWQRSTDGGLTWTDLGAARDSTPVKNTGLNMWEYITEYSIPPGDATMGNNGDLYRVLVATTAGNLSNANCRVTDGVSYITIQVGSCGPLLKVDLLSFSGKLQNDKAALTWTTSREDEQVSFTVERSTDGSNFSPIAHLQSRNNGSAVNTYNLLDPDPVTGVRYYRVILTSAAGKQQYSKVVMLSRDANAFALLNVINPFTSKLDFEVMMPASAKVDVQLTDLSGKVVRRTSYVLSQGVHNLTLPDLDPLSSGLYILQAATSNGDIITRKVVKKSK